MSVGNDDSRPSSLTPPPPRWVGQAKSWAIPPPCITRQRPIWDLRCASPLLAGSLMQWAWCRAPVSFALLFKWGLFQVGKWVVAVKCHASAKEKKKNLTPAAGSRLGGGGALTIYGLSLSLSLSLWIICYMPTRSKFTPFQGVFNFNFVP